MKRSNREPKLPGEEWSILPPCPVVNPLCEDCMNCCKNDAGYSKECSFFIPDQQCNQEKSGPEYEPDRKRNLTENQKKGETAENEF